MDEINYINIEYLDGVICYIEPNLSYIPGYCPYVWPEKYPSVG